MFGPGAIVRTIITFGFVWFAVPHEPDVGFGRPGAIEPTTAASAADVQCGAAAIKPCDSALFHAAVESIGDMARMRWHLLDGVERVRSDLRDNGRVHLSEPATILASIGR